MVILIITGKYPANKGENNIFKLLRNSAHSVLNSQQTTMKSLIGFLQLKLEGFDDEWSDWNNKMKKIIPIYRMANTHFAKKTKTISAIIPINLLFLWNIAKMVSNNFTFYFIYFALMVFFIR